MSQQQRRTQRAASRELIADEDIGTAGRVFPDVPTRRTGAKLLVGPIVSRAGRVTGLVQVFARRGAESDERFADGTEHGPMTQGGAR